MKNKADKGEGVALGSIMFSVFSPGDEEIAQQGGGILEAKIFFPVPLNGKCLFLRELLNIDRRVGETAGLALGEVLSFE